MNQINILILIADKITFLIYYKKNLFKSVFLIK